MAKPGENIFVCQNLRRCNYFELLGKVGDVSLLLHDIQLI